MSLKEDAVVAITGASSGIGAAIARKLSNGHRRLILIARNEARLKELEIEISGAEARATDISIRSEVEALFAEIPTPDVWINNAGIARGQSPLDETSADDLDMVIDVNLRGALHAARLAMKGMRARGSGHVVMITSAAAFNPYRGGHVYSISKAGLHMLAQSLRHDINGLPIRVSEIAPGIVGDTDFSARRHNGDLSAFKSVYEGVETLTSADIADAVDYCISAPPRVNVDLMVIYPVQQHGGSGIVHRRRRDNR
jgi:3-hydroxy acid dehydrogenase / malonic semialdehyde reductase